MRAAGAVCRSAHTASRGIQAAASRGIQAAGISGELPGSHLRREVAASSLAKRLSLAAASVPGAAAHWP